MDKLKSFLSRKLIVTLLTTILVPILQAKGVPQETINWILTLVSTYIGGQSVVDTMTAYRTNMAPANPVPKN